MKGSGRQAGREPDQTIQHQGEWKARPQAWETNEKNWKTSEKWETNERKWETSQPETQHDDEEKNTRNPQKANQNKQSNKTKAESLRNQSNVASFCRQGLTTLATATSGSQGMRAKTGIGVVFNWQTAHLR